MSAAYENSIIGDIYGPILAGTYLNILLYGVTVAQVYLYCKTFKKDRLWMRFYILALFLADTLNTVLCMVLLYTSLINQFGDVVALQKANWLMASEPALTGIIGAMVQLFFAWRVKVLTNSVWATTVISFFAIIEFMAAISTAGGMGYLASFLLFPKIKPAIIVWLFASAICDVFITYFLVKYLRQHRSGFARTDDMLDRIMRLTVQTGLLTSSWTVISCIIYIVYIDSGLHLAFNFPLCKLYANALLSSLNARGGWAYKAHGDSDGDTLPSHSVSLERSKHRPDVVSLPARLNEATTGVIVSIEHHEMVDRSPNQSENLNALREAGESFDEMKVNAI